MFGKLVFVSLLIGSLESSRLQIPTLGRPFALGDLYNIKNDQVIRGPKLWSYKNLSDFAPMIQRKTKFEIIASEEVEDQWHNFDIDARISLSFLGGLVSVSGSAGFLNDRVKTSKTARVSLKYDTRTFYRSLKPEHFTKVDFPEVLNKAPDATHVVTGIEYGVGAIFVFDQTISDYQDKKEVQGAMEIAVTSLPGIQIEGSGKVKLTEKQKKNTKQFTCKFHGDLVLDQHPGNYEEAVRVYKRLPELLGDNYENSVPMAVSLYPLDALPINKESEIVHEIRNSLVHEVTVKLNELKRFEFRCNDILLSEMATFHERVRTNVAAFDSNVQLYTLLFKQELARLLPVVRSAGKEDLLASMLADKEASTFSDSNLDQWMDDAEEEAIVLTSTQKLPGYCKHEGDFTAKLLNGVKYTIALVMRLDSDEDDFLAEMKKYLDENISVRADNSSGSAFAGKRKWWTSNELVSELQRKSQVFSRFSQLEEKRKEQGFDSSLQFLTIEMKLGEGETPSVSLELYEHAKLIDSDYQIPTAPSQPSDVSLSHDGVTLEWEKSAAGESNVKFYEVETFIVNGNESEFEKVKATKVPKGSSSKGKETARIAGLKPERSYFFTVSAFSALGRTSVGEASGVLATDTCPKGTFFTDGDCEPCPPMHFSDREGARACLACPPGAISRGYGNVACSPCPKGTYAADTRCVPCDPGYFSDVEGANVCQKCPLGTYGPVFGGSGCRECPEGSTTVVSGSKYVDDCGADLNGKIKSSFDEFTKGITQWQSQTNDKLKLLGEPHCAMGHFMITHAETFPIDFGRTFAAKPKVQVSISGIKRRSAKDPRGVWITIPEIGNNIAYIEIKKPKEIVLVGVNWQACL